MIKGRSARDIAEIILVAILALGGSLAYIIAYWPWRENSPITPLQYFAAMPLLVVTVALAFSLGSQALAEYWQAQVAKYKWFCWVAPTLIVVLYAGGTYAAGFGVLLNCVILGLVLFVPVALARVGKLWADWAMILAAWLPYQLKLYSLPLMPLPRQPDIWNHWLRTAYKPTIPASFDATETAMAKALAGIPRIPDPMRQISIDLLLIACIAFWAILVVRKLDGFQFRLLFSFEDFKLGAKLFALFAVVAMPISSLTGFAHWDRLFTIHQTEGYSPWLVYTLMPIGMYFGVALVEEALFRGILQNLLSKSFKNPWIGWVLASLAFGAVHIKGESPWQYAIFAACAGGVYGYAYMKTGRIMTGAITHAMVNSLWLAMFNPAIR